MPLPLPDFPHPVHVNDAYAMQRALRARLQIADDMGTIRQMAGVDVGYNLRTGMSRASIVVLDWQSLEVIEQCVIEKPTVFPYVTGLLSFREAPVILAALAQLRTTPDALMVDGQGIAHPRRMGIAAHLGVLLDMPAIGVAKSRLTGSYDEPGQQKGASSPLMDKGERIGTVLRSREGVKPLFISPGHRVGVETATAWVMHSLTRYRLPEPTRLADKYSKAPKGD